MINKSDVFLIQASLFLILSHLYEGWVSIGFKIIAMIFLISFTMYEVQEWREKHQ